MQKEFNVLLRGELIGKEVSVPKININGKIIDETKNTITILTEGKARKMIEKKLHKFIIKGNNGIVEIDGALITNRPEDRIKRLVKKQ